MRVQKTKKAINVCTTRKALGKLRSTTRKTLETLRSHKTHKYRNTPAAEACKARSKQSKRALKTELYLEPIQASTKERFCKCS